MSDIDIYKEAQVAIQNAYGIYLDHQKRLGAASNAISGILAKIDEQGMNEDNYVNAGNLLKKVNVTVKSFTEERKPVTQAAQAIVKAFTAQENALDAAKPDTDAYKLKKLMDDYATLKEAERRKKAEEERIKIEKEREVSTVLISAMSFLERVCVKASAEIKANITALANSIDLQNYDEVKKRLLSLDTRIPESLFGDFDVEIRTVYLGKDEKQKIIDDLRENSDWEEMQKEFSQEVGLFLQETIASLPSIRKELEEIEAASAVRAEELKKEKLKREFEENKRQEEERKRAQQALEEQEQEKMRKASLQAEFDFGIATAEAESVVKAKSSYVIELKMPVGLMEITQFWIHGQEWPMDEKKVMTVSFERMVKFAENEASKNNKFIKSDYVKYKPIVQSKF